MDMEDHIKYDDPEFKEFFPLICTITYTVMIRHFNLHVESLNKDLEKTKGKIT